MTFTLDPVTEQRIQRILEQGPFHDPSELLNQALDLLDSREEWLLRNKDAINQRIEASLAQAERGEVHTPEEVRNIVDGASKAHQAAS